MQLQQMLNYCIKINESLCTSKNRTHVQCKLFTETEGVGV